MPKLFIRDDLGNAWTFSERKSRVHLVYDKTPGGGYICTDWLSAIETLNDFGYITGKKIKAKAVENES